MSGEFYRLFEQPRPCLDGGNCDKNPATVCLGLSLGFCLVQYSSDDDGGDIEGDDNGGDDGGGDDDGGDIQCETLPCDRVSLSPTEMRLSDSLTPRGITTPSPPCCSHGWIWSMGWQEKILLMLV